VNLVNAFSFDPPWEELGVWRLLQATREELQPGAEWVYRRRLLIVEGEDVAAATDRIFPLLGVADGASGISLRVEPPGSRAVVLVQRAGDAAPVTQLVSSSSGGAARAVLPPGEYQLSVRAEHREPQQLSVSVEPGSFSKVSVVLPAPAWLRFDRAFADAGPGRVVVEGMGDTPDPVFGAELLDFRVDGEPPGSATETRDLYFLGGAGDARRVPIAPGRYRLTATRGPTHGIDQVELLVPGPGSEVRVPTFELSRVVALVSNAARLANFVAEGIDVMVSTDHDHVGDFREALETLELADRIRVRTGVEVTSSAPSHAAPWSAGHHNAWPVPHRPELHRQGAPPSQELGVAEIYALLRREYGVRVVQLNHALAGDRQVDQGDYLSHLGTAGEPYDPARPIDARGNRLLLERASDGRTRAVDFDAMEIMNGRSFEQYLVLREVWYSLLRQGFRRTATGNSDTHDLREEAGYPRNYVYVDDQAGGHHRPAAGGLSCRRGKHGRPGPGERRRSERHARGGGGSLGACRRGAPAGEWAGREGLSRPRRCGRDRSLASKREPEPFPRRLSHSGGRSSPRRRSRALG
jgi:hypothetical protein